eukprot:52330-Eustigmatos_ZCMA.PRE.1
MTAESRVSTGRLSEATSKSLSFSLRTVRIREPRPSSPRRCRKEYTLCPAIVQLICGCNLRTALHLSC